MAQSLATLLLLPLLLGLGLWQLQRAELKAALFASEAAAMQAAPQPVTALAHSALPHHVSASGHYDHRLFLLDNRVRDGRAGYEVLAPLRLADGRGVLVDRGWVAQGASRQQRPTLHVPTDEQHLTALALTPAPPPLSLKTQKNTGWPRVVQSALPQHLADELGYTLLPVVLYPDGTQAAVRERAALHHFGPERHRAYALQWFVMAALLLFFYLRHGLSRGKPE